MMADASTQAAGSAARAAAAAAAGGMGFNKTVDTSPQGDQSTTTTAKKTLLGT
jgi:hypothetical protein